MAAELEADRQERQEMIQQSWGEPSLSAAPEPSVPRVLDLGLDLGRVEPVALKDESPMMVCAPPSRSGSGTGSPPHARQKVQLTREEADFAVHNCGISVEEYWRQKQKHQHLKTVDPDRYGGRG